MKWQKINATWRNICNKMHTNYDNSSWNLPIWTDYLHVGIHRYQTSLLTFLILSNLQKLLPDCYKVITLQALAAQMVIHQSTKQNNLAKASYQQEDDL